MTLLELITIILAHIILFAIVLIVVAVGFFLMVLTGLANSYGEHDQLMRWFKKILRRIYEDR